MKLWQLSLVIWAAIAAMPFAVRAISTTGIASTGVERACASTKDRQVIEACRELLAEAG